MIGASLYASETVPQACSEHQAFRESPAGVLVRRVIAFPGSGGSYPIGPGEVRTVAIAAIDHRVVRSDIPDLSGADFETWGAGTADNPAVPNMLDVGLEPFVLAAGGVSLHPLGPNREVFVLAEPVDVASLPTPHRDGTGRAWALLPASSITDAAGLTNIWADGDRDSPPCVPMTHPDFDRYEGGFLDIGGPLTSPRSFQRRALRAESGRVILQNTNTSATDFMVEIMTPEGLPN